MLDGSSAEDGEQPEGGATPVVPFNTSEDAALGAGAVSYSAFIHLVSRRQNRESHLPTRLYEATVSMLLPRREPGQEALQFGLTSGIISVCLDLAGLFRNKDIHLC